MYIETEALSSTHDFLYMQNAVYNVHVKLMLLLFYRTPNAVSFSIEFLNVTVYASLVSNTRLNVTNVLVGATELLLIVTR